MQLQKTSPAGKLLQSDQIWLPRKTMATATGSREGDLYGMLPFIPCMPVVMSDHIVTSVEQHNIMRQSRLDSFLGITRQRKSVIKYGIRALQLLPKVVCF